ncbi:HNH endonuclease domain-containing protein [Saliterribacillus persicus]|uniref:5-methylcytosine-specific restriction endonuclease McrA n=1 Tax=Saliterribacillus persicus TaxID=930114 RepID=A0A368YDR5_9BACI|nr:HNH endonuclease domain-containing protein [Saliterribacillus persicus]RCW77027.1 5-methylcytosine-specific restriction endonuclease McrA [Saliterribacillus persicus]
MSYKLKIGELKEGYLTDEEIWRIFTIVLSSKSVKSSTYKYALIKSLIENLYQVNERCELTYDQLAYAFAKIYWNLIVKHNLENQNRGKKAKVVTIIKEMQWRHQIPSDFSFDKLNAHVQVKLITEVKKTMKENVFGAIYGDTREKFYAFEHKSEYFKINPSVYRFMLKYQRLLVNLTNYHMAAMMEQLNEVPSINYLLGKVESIAKRSSLRPFENILLNHFERSCFYCGKALPDGKRQIQVDHFIPWSFVQSDQLWNLVLSCNTCNSSKRDKLPKKYYLDNIINRNEELVDKQEENVMNLMTNYKDKKIILLYDYSIKNGFDTIWERG